eukprot:Selendium_serpulae@DN1808_c0_g1_i2.p2
MNAAITANPKMGFVSMLRLLCGVKEYSEIPVRHNEEHINEELAGHCPFPLKYPHDSESPHGKAFLLLQAHMFDIAMPITDYTSDLNSVLFQCPRILQAIADVACIHQRLTTALHALLMLQCLHQGTHPLRNSLLTLPGLTEEHTTALSQQFKVEGIADFAEMEESEIRRILSRLRSLTPPQSNALVKILTGLPQLRVKVSLAVEDEDRKVDVAPLVGPAKSRDAGVPVQRYVVPVGAVLQIKVDVRYANVPERVPWAKKRVKQKEMGWWCLVGDFECDELINFKRLSAVPILDNKRNFNTKGPRSSVCRFQVHAPPDPGAFGVAVVLGSDSHVGLDQQIDFVIETVDPTADWQSGAQCGEEEGPECDGLLKEEE